MLGRVFQVDQEVPNGHNLKDGEMLCHTLHPTEFRIPEIRHAEDEQRSREYVKRITPGIQRARKFPRPLPSPPGQGGEGGVDRFSSNVGLDRVRKMQQQSPSMLERIGGAVNKQLNRHFLQSPPPITPRVCDLLRSGSLSFFLSLAHSQVLFVLQSWLNLDVYIHTDTDTFNSISCTTTIYATDLIRVFRLDLSCVYSLFALATVMPSSSKYIQSSIL